MRHIKWKIFILSLLSFTMCGLQAQTVKDVDGNVYKTVTIGKQIWMMENLKTTKFRDGKPIPKVLGKSWDSLKTAAFFDYDNSVDSSIYGRLYNWYAVNDARNIAPKGWHVASDSDWKILIDYLGGENVAGGKLKEKGTSHWEYFNDATNETFFTALPGGSPKLGTYGVRDFGLWWTSTEENATNAYYVTMKALGSEINSKYKYVYFKSEGFSVRCVKD